MMNKQARHRRLVRYLRAYYLAPASFVTEEQLLRVTEGAFGRAKIELRLALRDLRHALRNVWRRLRVLMGRKP
jgi:hypothetical protein